jgi:Protein of unknown function (DUF4238)
MSTPKRHHYLPQMYLRGFCTNNKLWLFDRDKHEYRQQTPNKVCHKRHYYSQIEENGDLNTSIESILSELETTIAPVICKIDNNETISLDERSFLSMFIALLYTRVPVFEQTLDTMIESMALEITQLKIRTKKMAQRSIQRYKEETGNDITLKDMKDIVEGKYKITVHPNYRIRMMVEMVLPLAEVFMNMSWHFIQTPRRKSFVTSDIPVIVSPPDNYKHSAIYGIGFATPGAVTVVPLTQKTCLLIKDDIPQVVSHQVTDNFVRRINLLIASGCDRYIIGNAKELITSIVKRTNISKRPRVSRIKIGKFH